MSENIKWRKQGDMKKGTAKLKSCYSYASVDGHLFIREDEAEVVRLIFDLFLGELGQTSIANRLNELGYPSPTDGKWHSSSVSRVLKNEKVSGDVLHGKRYTTDHLTKTVRWNKGEMPMYFIADAHEAIVSKDVFERAKAEIARRALCLSVNDSSTFVFRNKIKCCVYGSVYQKTSGGYKGNRYMVWKCKRKMESGASYNSHILAEKDILKTLNEALGLDEFDGEVFTEKVERIVIYEDRVLSYFFYDGTVVTKQIEFSRKRGKGGHYVKSECSGDSCEKA